MIIDYILLGLVVVLLGVIIFIIAKKFPIISSINTDAIPEQKMKEVKNGLLEKRLRRKFVNVKIKTSFHLKPIADKIKIGFQNLYNQILEMEKKYQKKAKEVATPEEKEELKKKTSILLEEGERLNKEENFKEAEKKYIEIISFDHKKIEAYKGLGEVYFNMKDFQHAKEIFKHVLKLDSESDAAYSSLGTIAAYEGHLEEAKEDYLHSLVINNKLATHHINLGETYKSLGDCQKALDSFKEAFKLEPNNPKILDSLIEACIECKDKSLAKETWQKLKEANPENEKLSEFKERIDQIK